MVPLDLLLTVGDDVGIVWVCQPLADITVSLQEGLYSRKIKIDNDNSQLVIPSVVPSKTRDYQVSAIQISPLKKFKIIIERTVGGAVGSACGEGIIHNNLTVSSV